MGCTGLGIAKEYLLGLEEIKRDTEREDRGDRPAAGSVRKLSCHAWESRLYPEPCVF